MLTALSVAILVAVASTSAQQLVAGAATQDTAFCKDYAPLYHSIDNDLQLWQATGISEKLMQSTIRDHATLPKRHHSQKGFAVAFQQGIAYVMRQPDLTWAGHHIAIWIVYMKALLELQQRFGSTIPDVEFVISTVDRPLKLISNTTSKLNQPVLRFCKTDAHPDVLVPCFHFYVKSMVPTLLTEKSWLDKQYPWSERAKVLFGRFSPYDRHLHADDPFAQRMGAGGTTICNSRSRTAVACPVRQHFVQWAQAQNSSLFDVKDAGRLSMRNHAKYRYLLHLDGQGLSSRLEQLLALGSVVFKEESGYRGFYHLLLKPFVHYMPFWKKVPEEVVDSINWVLENDDKAQAIATASQEFAQRYFTRDALDCYMLTLLTKLSQLQGYLKDRASVKYYMTAEQYLESIAKKHEGGRHDRYWEFAHRQSKD